MLFQAYLSSGVATQPGQPPCSETWAWVVGWQYGAKPGFNGELQWVGAQGRFLFSGFAIQAAVPKLRLGRLGGDIVSNSMPNKIKFHVRQNQHHAKRFCMHDVCSVWHVTCFC